MCNEDKRERQKQVDSLRHAWHEMVAADPGLRRHTSAQIVATYVRKRFRSDLGYAEFSIGGLVKDMQLNRRSAIRGRNKLIERGWIRLVKRQTDQSHGWAANRYILTGGPEDCDLTSHSSTLGDADDTGAPVS